MHTATASHTTQSPFATAAAGARRVLQLCAGAGQAGGRRCGEAAGHGWAAGCGLGGGPEQQRAETPASARGVWPLALLCAARRTSSASRSPSSAAGPGTACEQGHNKVKLHLGLMCFPFLDLASGQEWTGMVKGI